MAKVLVPCPLVWNISEDYDVVVGVGLFYCLTNSDFFINKSVSFISINKKEWRGSKVINEAGLISLVLRMK